MVSHRGPKLAPADDRRPMTENAVDFKPTSPAASNIDGSTPESHLAAHSRTTAPSTSRRPPDPRPHRVPPRPELRQHPIAAALRPRVLPQASGPRGPPAGDAVPHGAR